MTDDNDNAFTEILDPYQARQGRREALQFTLALYNSQNKDTYKSVEALLQDAEKIDQYLEDGSVPPAE